MAQIIAIINFKGGIAKTTTAIHLGASLALLKYKVLILDYDPQTSLSIGYKVKKDNQYTINDLLDGKDGFRVTQKDKNLHVLPGTRKIVSRVRDIGILKVRLEQLNEMAIENKQKPYDFIILDCPPMVMERTFFELKNKLIHIPNLNEIALTAADYTLIPLNAEKYSIEGLKELISDIKNLRNDFNQNLNIAGVFFSMVLKNERNFKDYYSIVKDEMPEEYFFNTFIRKDVNIEKSKEKGLSIFSTAPKSNAALDYKNLAKELIKKIKI